MKWLVFAPKEPLEVRRPTIAQQPAPALIFSGWGPRLA
jgi:hypothetical protein